MKEISAQAFVNSLYWPEPTNGILESDIEVKHTLGQAKSLVENSFKAGWDAANKQNNPLSKEQGEEWMRIMMSLVRVGYQHASTEIFSYCIENKVSPQFQDFIASMLNEENKKQFSYEMFKDELKKMQDEPLPIRTSNVPVSDTTEADSSNADDAIKFLYESEERSIDRMIESTKKLGNTDHQIKITELREKFFKECVVNNTHLEKVLAHYKDPEGLFEWFKPYLKIPSIDLEGLEDAFCNDQVISESYTNYEKEEIFNFFKTKLQDYIK